MRNFCKSATCCGAVVTAIMLSGCGNGLSKHSLAKKIDAAIGQKPVCWALSNMPASPPFKVSPQNDPIISGLAAGGYIKISALGADFLGNVRAVQIDLTDKGRSTGVWDQKTGFCIGTRAVDAVEQWTLPAADGTVQATQISYTWKIVDKPDWANEKLFMAVQGMSQPVEATAVAQKTSEGWQLVGDSL